MAYVKYFSRICTRYEECRSVGAKRKLYARRMCLNCYTVDKNNRKRQESPDVNPKSRKPYSEKYRVGLGYNEMGYSQSEREKDRKLFKTYGITLSEYRAMPQVCGICGVGKCQTGRLLNVDHDHDTGKVRELLCGNCNKAIGLLHHSPVLVEAALTYLRRNT